MRINGSTAIATAATASTARRGVPGAFFLSGAEPPRTANAAAAVRTVGGIEALIALQGLEDAAERRRQAVRRGRMALDALDELKVGLLGGTLSPTTLTSLRMSAAFLKGRTGEAGLDNVLSEIELRVEVEIAKIVPR